MVKTPSYFLELLNQVTAASMPRAEAVVSKNSDDTLARCKVELITVVKRLAVYFVAWLLPYFHFST